MTKKSKYLKKKKTFYHEIKKYFSSFLKGCQLSEVSASVRVHKMYVKIWEIFGSFLSQWFMFNFKNTPTNIQFFKVNNRDIEKDVKYILN